MKRFCLLSRYCVALLTTLFLLAILGQANATVVPISFDMGPDGVFTAADGNLSPLVATPSTYGSLGRFSSGILCLGPGDGDFSGSGRPSGLFNINSASGSGSYSQASTFSSGAVISSALGTTGWGIIGGSALLTGTYNFGFRTTTGNFGWMNVTLNTTGPVITINQAYVETVVGQSITIGTTGAAAPTVTNVTPASGSTTGGTSVTITGTNFTGATGVTIGGAAATSVVVSNATTITCTTPAGTAGTASVLVTTPGGTNAANTLFTYYTPAPEIAVFDGTSPPANERTDNVGTFGFGSVNTGSSSAAQTFTIQNLGSATADLTGLAVSSTNASEFTFTAPLITTLAPGATTTFTVTFTPSATGARSGVINIASNDADENPFRINVGGTGTTPVPVVTTFNYTGAAQTFIVPAGVTSVNIQAWGAQGFNSQGFTSNPREKAVLPAAI
jgi:hypothetical protein